jgi:hypothetical protein
LDEDNKIACVSFLEALSCRIASVEFASPNDHVQFDDLCSSVLRACPGLKNLILPSCTGIETLKSFRRFAEDGTSTLEVLVVGCFVHLELMGLIELLEALADATHPLVKSLCELELNIIADGEDEDNEYDDDSEDDYSAKSAFISAVPTMLDRNGRLYSISFLFEDFDDISDFKWDNEEIAIPTAPVPIRSKLAQLSVTGHTNSTIGTNTVHLDSSVLMIIFQFAAPHRMHQLYTQRESERRDIGGAVPQ